MLQQGAHTTELVSPTRFCAQWPKYAMRAACRTGIVLTRVLKNNGHFFKYVINGTGSRCRCAQGSGNQPWFYRTGLHQTWLYRSGHKLKDNFSEFGCVCAILVAVVVFAVRVKSVISGISSLNIYPDSFQTLCEQHYCLRLWKIIIFFFCVCDTRGHYKSSPQDLRRSILPIFLAYESPIIRPPPQC